MRLLLILTFFLVACTDIEIQRGAELKQDKINRITKESVKGDVINLLGSPSSKSSFGDETWFYIFNKRTQEVIGSDKVIDQEVLAIAFDVNDQVKDVKIYDASQAKDIEFSDKKTATAGHELGILEQVLGNIGKFNKDGDGRTHSSGRTGP